MRKAVFLLGTFLLGSVLWGDTYLDYAQKIHGKDSSGNKITCKSYETDLTPEMQKNLIEHAMISSAAYQDHAKAYGDTERIDAYKETPYVPLSQTEVEALIAGSGLTVHSDGNTVMVSGSDKNALNAVLFKDPADGTIIISYRGSKELVDWVDDGVQVSNTGEIPDQYRDSSTLLKAVLANSTANIVCDGHSLGGGEVTYAMADNDIMAVDANGNSYSRVTGFTYNAAGLSESTLRYIENSHGSAETIKNAAQNITNVRNEMDLVSYVGYHLGDTYEVTWSASPENMHTPLNDHGIEHLIENMISASGLENVWDIVESPAGTQTGSGGGAATKGGGGATPPKGKTTLGSLVLSKINGLIDAQLAKLETKYPILKEVFAALNINGSSITGAAINIFNVLKNAKTMQQAFKGLAHLAIEGLKNMAASIINWGLDKLEGLLNNMINKALDWLMQKLNSWANSTNSRLVRMALGFAQQGLAKWRKKGVSTAVHTLRQKGVIFIQKKVNGGNPPSPTGGTVYQDIINRVH